MLKSLLSVTHFTAVFIEPEGLEAGQLRGWTPSGHLQVALGSSSVGRTCCYSQTLSCSQRTGLLHEQACVTGDEFTHTEPLLGLWFNGILAILPEGPAQVGDEQVITGHEVSVRKG